jgi:hypothetical protein
MKAKMTFQTDQKSRPSRHDETKIETTPTKTGTARRPPLASRDLKSLAKKAMKVIVEKNQLQNDEDGISDSRNDWPPSFGDKKAQQKSYAYTTQRKNVHHRQHQIPSNLPGPRCLHPDEYPVQYQNCCTCSLSSSHVCYNQFCGQMHTRAPLITQNCSHPSTCQSMSSGHYLPFNYGQYNIQPQVYAPQPQQYVPYYPNSVPVMVPQQTPIYTAPYVISSNRQSFMNSQYDNNFNNHQPVYIPDYNTEGEKARTSRTNRKSYIDERFNTENDRSQTNRSQRKMSKRVDESKAMARELEKARKMIKELQQDKRPEVSPSSTTSIHQDSDKSNFNIQIDEIIEKLKGLHIKGVKTTNHKFIKVSENSASKVPFPRLEKQPANSFMIPNLDRFVKDDRTSNDDTYRSKAFEISEEDSMKKSRILLKSASLLEPTSHQQENGSKYNFHKKKTENYDQQPKTLASDKFIFIGNNLPVLIENKGVNHRDEYISDKQDLVSRETEERYKKLKKTLFHERQDSDFSNPFKNI